MFETDEEVIKGKTSSHFLFSREQQEDEALERARQQQQAEQEKQAQKRKLERMREQERRRREAVSETTEISCLSLDSFLSLFVSTAPSAISLC